MSLYDGGSEIDTHMMSVTGNTYPGIISSSGNQMFISFTTDGHGLGKGFSAVIMFGKDKELLQGVLE